MATELENLNAPISDETWAAFVRAHDAHIDALDVLSEDPDSHASLFVSFTDEPTGGVGIPKSPAEMDALLRKLETTAPLTPDKAAVIAAEGKQLHDTVHQTNTELHNVVNSLKDKKTKPADAEWNKWCDDHCAAMIKKVTEPIKAGWAKVKRLGRDHPAARGILQTIMHGFEAFVDSVLGFLNRALAWVKHTLETIWHAVAAAADWVWDKVKRAANAVKSFFAHLF